MDLVNGMVHSDSCVAGKAYDSHPWWQRPGFPLIPLYSFSWGNKWNEPSFSISWLNIRLWSIMSCALEIKAELDDSGFHVAGQLAYLRFVVWLFRFPIKWHQKTWLKPLRRFRDEVEV